MSLDTAIKNVGDYYAAHYLADKKGFSKDIAEKVKGWKERGSQSIPRKLAALGETYFKAKTEALNYDDPLLRVRADNEAINRWHPALLDALGYRSEPFGLVLESAQKQIPVLHRLNRHNQPWLVIAEAPFCLTGGESDEEPLEQAVIARTPHVDGLPTLSESWEKAVALLFKQEDAPRWVMLLAGGRIYLFDAHTFAQGRYLWIDLDEAFGRRQAATFDAIAALLSDEALVPQGESDEVLHERLREGSLKSTHGVSEKLQGAVRDAIEAIANGWVEARRQNNLGYRQLSEREELLPDGSREITAEQLRHDALIYVYRLLFCFYAEARGGELGILPINDDVYRLGYSLESLRDLVDANEPGTTTENGTYIAEHLERLFQLIYDGFDPERESSADEETESPFGQGLRQESLFGAPAGEQLSLKGTGMGRSKYTPGKVFAIQPLTATLFDPQAAPLLSRVKLPNRILHKVVRCLSLGTSQQSKRVGRINYAELGIVQLGSVYEGLLSYKGFFAAEDLIQVHQKAKNGKPMLDNAIDSKVSTWFVPAHRENEFKAGEIVLEHRTERTRIYRTGEFILHLNGVDRVNSASYYTPEVLTRTLVEEALKERLKDFGPEQADDILDLKICEPAMGSAAFLVEAIDQLAHHYLELKQKQLGENIDPSNYEDELRRVRHYIAVHNVYGVDLNPVAVELGALSLWLSTIHRLKVSEGDEDNQPLFQPAATPWFGLRLRAGNSLIGARRSVWKKDQLLRGKHYGKNAEIPRQLKPGEDRQPGEIYHFLVWDEDMAPAASDKLMKEHWPDECDAITTWRKKQVKTKCSVEEVARLERLSERIDELWKDYSISRQRALADSACTSSVWPKAQNSLEALRNGPTLRRQEGLKASLEAESGAFQRLKLLMDSWCSFYFWPLDQSDNLPSREAWLAAAEVLLGIGTDDLATRAMLDIQLGEEIELEALFQASEQKLPDAEHLSELVPWYGVGRSTTADQNFHHWELIFTEILGPQVQEVSTPRGFDLMFGNPPWVGADWKSAPLLNEYEPVLGVRDVKSATYNKERPKLLQDPLRRDHYQAMFSAGEGAATFLNDVTLYPALAGLRTNLYKNFIERSWTLLALEGIGGLLHPESVFDDGRGGPFRASYYPRLRAHYQYENERQRELFADVNARQTFSINVFGAPKETAEFVAIFNLFGGHTLKHCLKHDRPEDPIPGIKDANGDWEVKGHTKRVLRITERELKLFASLLDDEGTPAIHARLPLVHSEPLLKVLTKFANASIRLGDLRGQYYASDMINEVNGQRDGVITRIENPSYQPASADEWVISGPHFYVGNPFNKTPRTVCTEKNHYDSIDLESIPEDYLPRGVYRPGDEHGNLDAFYKAIPEWPKPQKPVKTESGWQPGFWPVAEHEVTAYEALLGEPLKLYGVGQARPGAKTARRFGFFSRWEGDVPLAVSWLASRGADRNSAEFSRRFGDVRLDQRASAGCDLCYVPKPLTANPRLVYRRRGQPANERTLIPAIVPPGVTHIHPVLSYTYLDAQILTVVSGHSFSLLYDVLVRVAGRSDIYDSTLRPFPIVDKNFWPFITLRVLRLSCLTNHYAELWEELFESRFTSDRFAFEDAPMWTKLSAIWDQDIALRKDSDRRQAELELDVLLAIGFGLSVDELIQVYLIQFSALVEYEKFDEYDSCGQRLPNTKRKDAGGKEVRAIRADHDGVSPLTVSWEIDNGNQTVTKTFYPPFSHVDRIEDYRTAYRVFSERLGRTENNKEPA
ncbi:N-6 DNA methylase [uncultured Alcanivorax sp.]|uniref:N-6 DNA methylase n=1 Tax=uncultured Alcanivorax sp. TaxID=191215 RepID=UPI00262B21A3|nr:N-6 DNA methylase [uncultured Alcanivorax sp.]